jgi:hypothetical protein
MTTHRRYWFVHPGQSPSPEAHSKTLEIMQRWCEKYWWYNEPKTEGEPFDRFSFSFTVTARDQWWVHRRAMKLAEACYYALGVPPSKIPDPLWEVLPPHTNRGRYRVPRSDPLGKDDNDGA